MRRWRLAALAAALGLVVAAVWYWPVVFSLGRLLTAGWITVVDGPMIVPDATRSYRPLARVAGVDNPQPLPRASRDHSRRLAEALALAEATASYSLLVWHDGAVVLERNWNGGGPDTRADSASMHKTVTALAVGAAVAEGHIPGLDTPVGTFITEWAEDDRGAIPLRHVLGMASGLSTTSSAGGAWSETMRWVAGYRMADTVLERRPLAPSGTVFAYRNLDTQLLGLILEQATGQSYADYLSAALWQPLGAADAFVWLDRPGGLARTYTGLLARAEDWMRIGLLVKDEGVVQGKRVLPQSWIEAMLTPSTLYPNYGLQIWIANPYQPMRYYNPASPGLGFPAAQPFLAEDMVFLDGVGGQRVYVSRALDLVIVRLGAAQPGWDDAALPNAVVRGLRLAGD